MSQIHRTILAAGIAATCLAVPAAASASFEHHVAQPETTNVDPTAPEALAGSSGRPDAKTATATYEAKPGTKVTSASTSFDWGSRNGWWILNLNGMPVAAGQAVTVSATELDAFGNEFIGSAPVFCQNVSVKVNRVSTRCLFDWGSPIRVRLHYVY